jgi:hypothetical protein
MVTPPCRRGTGGSLKKSISESQVVPAEQADAVPSVVAASQGSSQPVNRRNSDGQISITDFSTDDGPEPGSPNAFGVVDWSDTASSTAHIFVPTSSSIESCYLATECLHSGHRVKCVACRVISHEGCISTLNDRFPCKETFRECVRKYREQVRGGRVTAFHPFFVLDDHPAPLGGPEAAEGEVQQLRKDLSVQARIQI